MRLRQEKLKNSTIIIIIVTHCKYMNIFRYLAPVAKHNSTNKVANVCNMLHSVTVITGNA